MQSTMIQTSRIRGFLMAGFLGLAIMPSAAAAQLQGDCNNSGGVSIGEVVTCANIFLGITPIVQCIECDQNANGTVTIGEVVGAANCFSNSASESCRTVVPVATPTATVGVPTPTATETATPIPTPDTPTPDPTATPTESSSDVIVMDVKLQPPGGSDGNCRGMCTTGPNVGQGCGVALDCGVCNGGSNEGFPCVNNGGCPGSTCATGVCGGTKSCVGGPFDGTVCTTPQQCTECRANFAGGVAAGSCARIQGQSLRVIIAPNGVCVPRIAPPDVSCATDVECPGGKTCQLPGFRLEVDKFADEDGIRAVRVHGDSFALPPAPVPIGGFTACISAAGDGIGFIDCDGGTSGLNVTLERDHNTTPGSAGNSGPAASGFANDANCNTPLSTPLGTLSYPCLEGSKTCRGGENDQLRCDTVDDCPGADSCTACAAQDPPTFGHAGVCNSPNRATIAGAFGAGDMTVVMPLAIVQLRPDEHGPDGLPCTEDDVPASPGAAVPVTLSTGISTIRVFDSNNNATLKLTPESQCGISPCVTQIEGVPSVCADIDSSSNLAGTTFGGGFPALDVAVVGDIATTFKFVVQSSDLVE